MLKIFLIIFFGTNFLSAQNPDFTILKSINQTDLPAWDHAMKGLSFSVYPLSGAAVAGILIHGYVKKDKTLIRCGYKSAVSLLFALTVSTGTKYLVKRERPAYTYPNDITERDAAQTYSFPSGHTTAAFATATSLSLTYKKWYVAVPAYTYAGFVSYSRMRLGMHYPTDVLGGIILGVGSGFLTWKLDKILNRKKQIKLYFNSASTGSFILHFQG